MKSVIKYYREFFILISALASIGAFCYERPAPKKTAAPAAEKVLRVIAPARERVVSTLSPYGQGFEQELLYSFCKGAGYKLRWLEARGPEQALAALKADQVDLVVGLGLQPPESLGGPVAAGPAYAHYRPMLIRGSVKGLKSPGQGEVVSVSLPVIKNGLDRTLEDEDSKAVVEHDHALPPLLNELGGSGRNFALVDGTNFRLWQPFFQNVRPAKSLANAIPCRWFWSTKDKGLASALQTFWEYHETDLRLRELTERYFGFFPEKTDYHQLKGLSGLIGEQYPKYKDLIRKAGGRKNIDPLFLTSVIYVESRFNPRAVSRAGARGLMQFMPATAANFKINPDDPAQSIKAGAAYLRLLWDKLARYDLKPWDRWFFVLAAYNQGLGHLYDAMRLAREMGGTGKTWRELKEVYPLLSYEKYHSRAKYGYCSGRQAVRYVDEVRYCYYILHGLVALSRPEAEHLGPLSGDLSLSWPLG